jgi:hypothetical protein
VHEFWDDERLFDAMKETLTAWQRVPPEFIQAGKNAYAWHNIDAELALLTYDSADSAHDRAAAASMRSEPASVRALTFKSTHLTIEVEVSDDCLLGQVIPTWPGTMEIQGLNGMLAISPVDDLGSFRIQPIPTRPFRLNCRIAGTSGVLTNWITF